MHIVYILWSALIVVIIGLIFSFSKIDTLTPKFKSGDCIDYVFKGKEFLKDKQSGLTKKILKVGKEVYLIQYLYNGDVAEESISSIDDSSIKVNCITGEKI